MDTAIKAVSDQKESERVVSVTRGFPVVVGFIVSGDHDSAMGVRARSLKAKLSDHYNIQIAYRSRRKLISIFTSFCFLLRTRPAVVYLFDISYTGVAACGFYKSIFRKSLIIETGDAIVELVRSSGNRGRVGIWLTGLLEKAAFRIADRIVVRGSFHKEWLAQKGIHAEVIQDGVNVDDFVAEGTAELREQYGLSDVLTVGLVGSSIWSEKLEMCYGWELVEVLRLLRDRPVKGIMIGSGSGIAHLKARCREYGIEDKLIFCGQVAFEKLPAYLGLIDVCLSTQTNDVVGKVRTTGKLPLYLAAGKYVLASKVGEAELVLEPEMLVEYEGVKDQDYPRRLKERIETLLDHRENLERSVRNVRLARENFDYEVLAKRLSGVIQTAVSSRTT